MEWSEKEEKNVDEKNRIIITFNARRTININVTEVTHILISMKALLNRIHRN